MSIWDKNFGRRVARFKATMPKRVEELVEKWYKDNFRLNDKVFNVVHLWIRVTFRAASELGFDLKTISVENWLPGIETIGDLILTANMGRYGLTEEELNTRIYYHQ